MVQSGNKSVRRTKVRFNSVPLFDRFPFKWTSHTSWLAQSGGFWQKNPGPLLAVVDNI